MRIRMTKMKLVIKWQTKKGQTFGLAFAFQKRITTHEQFAKIIGAKMI